MIKINDESTEYINLLSYLNPAAAKLIVNCNTELPQLLKLTLLNLLSKEVLILKQNSEDKAAEDYIIVETGKNFSAYVPDEYEKYFTSVINDDLYYKLKPYIRKIFFRIESSYRYKKLIIENSGINSFFEFTKFNSFFRYLDYSHKGKQCRDNIMGYLNYVSENINTWIDNEPAKADKAIGILKENIFLIPDINSEKVRKLLYLINTVSDAETKNSQNSFSEISVNSCMIGIDDVYTAACTDIFSSLSDNFGFSDSSGDFGDGCDGGDGDGGGD